MCDIALLYGSFKCTCVALMKPLLLLGLIREYHVPNRSCSFNLGHRLRRHLAKQNKTQPQSDCRSRTKKQMLLLVSWLGVLCDCSKAKLTHSETDKQGGIILHNNLKDSVHSFPCLCYVSVGTGHLPCLCSKSVLLSSHCGPWVENDISHGWNVPFS